jgi:HAD superfamily hydrolase (TIGR01509 family)
MTYQISPKALLLDLDGTLADSLPVMRLSYREFLREFNCEASDVEFDSLNGPPLYEIVRHLKISHAIDEEEDMLLSNYHNKIDTAYLRVKPSQGAINLLKKAKDQHCIIGIVTSNTRKRTQSWLKAVNLSHMIDLIVSGDDVTQGKPHPEPYVIATKQSLYKTNEIVAIEDSPQGAKSAVDAGLKTLVLCCETHYQWRSYQWPTGVEPIYSLSQAAEQLW